MAISREGFYSVEELAKELHTSQELIFSMARGGKLPVIPLPDGSFTFFGEAILAWARENAVYHRFRSVTAPPSTTAPRYSWQYVLQWWNKLAKELDLPECYATKPSPFIYKMLAMMRYEAFADLSKLGDAIRKCPYYIEGNQKKPITLQWLVLGEPDGERAVDRVLSGFYLKFSPYIPEKVEENEEEEEESEEKPEILRMPTHKNVKRDSNEEMGSEKGHR